MLAEMRFQLLGGTVRGGWLHSRVFGQIVSQNYSPSNWALPPQERGWWKRKPIWQLPWLPCGAELLLRWSDGRSECRWSCFCSVFLGASYRQHCFSCFAETSGASPAKIDEANGDRSLSCPPSFLHVQYSIRDLNVVVGIVYAVKCLCIYINFN